MSAIRFDPRVAGSNPESPGSPADIQTGQPQAPQPGGQDSPLRSRRASTSEAGTADEPKPRPSLRPRISLDALGKTLSVASVAAGAVPDPRAKGVGAVLGLASTAVSLASHLGKKSSPAEEPVADGQEAPATPASTASPEDTAKTSTAAQQKPAEQKPSHEGVAELAQGLVKGLVEVGLPLLLEKKMGGQPATVANPWSMKV